MEGSPARGHKPDSLAALLMELNAAKSLADFETRFIRAMSAQLHHAKGLIVLKQSNDLDFGRLKSSEETSSIPPAWLKSHLERHPELLRKLQQSEMVGIAYTESSSAPHTAAPRRHVLLLPILVDRELVGMFGLVLPVDALQNSEEDVELIREVSQCMSPLLARLYELETLRLKCDEMDSLRVILQMQSHLQSNVAHELRTPLASVRGYTRMILDGRAGDIQQQQRDFLTVVSENANRLINLVNWMSHMLQYGPQHLDVGQTDLRELWTRCVQSQVENIRGKTIEFSQQISPDSFQLTCDRNKIEYVFNSLLANAIRSTNPCGRITVEFSRGRQNEITVKITDSGAGLPPEELNRVFDRYYGSSLPAANPTELGLAGVHDIIGLHGGRLFVSSRPGEGSTFLFTLPAVRQDIEETSGDEQAINFSRRRR